VFGVTTTFPLAMSNTATYRPLLEIAGTFQFADPGGVSVIAAKRSRMRTPSLASIYQ
jgi:hypothetical protein